MIRRAHTSQGERVTKSDAPSVEIPCFAANASAFASACVAFRQPACSTVFGYMRVSDSCPLQPWLFASQWGSPGGAPLYPQLMGRPLRSMTAPTCLRSQVPRSEIVAATASMTSTRDGLEVMVRQVVVVAHVDME